MESSPTSPTPYEYGDGDKGKAESKAGSKPPVRVPLPASEIHTSEPQRQERVVPLFQSFNERAIEAEERGKEEDDEDEDKDKEDTTEAPAAPDHIAALERDLWKELGQPPAAELNIPETTEKDTTVADKEFYDVVNTIDPEGELAKSGEALQGNDDKDQPRHVSWDETHTIHVNAPVPPVEAAQEIPYVSQEYREDTEADSPSAETIAAEVAATEPDDPGSVEVLDALYAAPAAEVATDHPEAYGEPLPALTEQEQFQSMMQNANMGKEFEQATSEFSSTPAASEEPHHGYPSGHSESYSDSGIDVAPYAYNTGSHVGAGAKGAVAAGGIMGGLAGYEAGKHAAHRQASELQQQSEQQAGHQDRRIRTLANEQRVSHEQIDRLQTNQRLAGEQQKHVTATTEAVAAATAAEAERVSSHSPDEKVVRSEWVDMVVDKRTGQLAEGDNINNFGAELAAEQRHNIAPPDPVGDALAAAKAAAQAASDVSNYEQVPASLQGGMNPMIGGGQMGFTHELPAGYGDGGQVDPNHRLPAPQSPVVAALSSPLLWVGVGVLLIAFFAAAFL